MKMLRIVEEIKTEINKKHELMEQRRSVADSIQKGEDFFIKESSSVTTPERLAEGAGLMVDYIKQLREIDIRLFSIDTMIVARLEAYFSDFVSKVLVPEKVNDAGDIIPKSQITFVPFESDDPNVFEVTIDDIWYLKILKYAVGATNVEILPKGEYYNKA